MTTPLIEVVGDEPGFFRLTRVGRWWHILDHETGEGEWLYGSETDAAERFHVVRKAKLPRSAPVSIRKDVA